MEYVYGSYCLNLGLFNNDIRRNTYTNVDAGNLAEENNAFELNPPRGLYYLCNTNTTQKYDFYVYPGGDIRQNQGLQITGTSNFKAAGNVFTKANSPSGDFENNGPLVRYYRYQVTEEPLFYSGLQYPFPFGQVNNCESDYCLPPCREKGEWQTIRSDYDSKRGLYLSAVSEMKAAQATGNNALAEQKSNLAAGYRLGMDELSNTLSLHMAFDTTTYSVDSVRTWWQKMDSHVSDMVVARDYLSKGQSNTAYSILDALPTQDDLSVTELADLADYRAIMQIIQSRNGGFYFRESIQQLLNYAKNGRGISAAWAKNILTVKGYRFLLSQSRWEAVNAIKKWNPKSISIMPVWYRPILRKTRFGFIWIRK